MRSGTACDVDVDVDVDVVTLTDAEAVAAFDARARRGMGTSGEGYLRRWVDGEWADVDLDIVPGLIVMSMAIPLVQQESSRAVLHGASRLLTLACPLTR